MRRDNRLVDVRHPVEQHFDERGELFGYRISHRVGNIDRRRAGPDRTFDDPAQKIVLGARAVFGRPLDIGAQVTRMGNAVDDCLMHLFRLHLQLDPHMQRTGRQKSMDPRLGRALQGFPGAVDILDRGARQTGDRAGFDDGGDFANGFEIAVRGDRKPGLNDIDTHFLEHQGDANLLVQVHRTAGRLFAVAQRGVENSDAVGIVSAILRRIVC